MTRIALYSGSFDPPTRGHEDLIRRAVRLADRLVVAIAVNPAKQPLFTVEERLELLRAAVGYDARISVDAFEGLLANYHFRDYAAKARELWDLLSRDNVAGGSVDRLVGAQRKRPDPTQKDRKSVV